MLSAMIEIISKFKETGKGVGFVLLIGIGMALGYALTKILNIELVQAGTLVRHIDIEKTHISKEQFIATKEDLSETRQELKSTQAELKELLMQRDVTEAKIKELDSVKSEIKFTTDQIDKFGKEFYRAPYESEKNLISSKMKQLYEQRENLEERATILTKSL